MDEGLSIRGSDTWGSDKLWEYDLRRFFFVCSEVRIEGCGISIVADGLIYEQTSTGDFED